MLIRGDGGGSPISKNFGIRQNQFLALVLPPQRFWGPSDHFWKFSACSKSARGKEGGRGLLLLGFFWIFVSGHKPVIFRTLKGCNYTQSDPMDPKIDSGVLWGVFRLSVKFRNFLRFLTPPKSSGENDIFRNFDHFPLCETH